jgi:alkylhydroperoxidase family enzyme
VFGEEVVQRVYRDWRTAPVDEKLRAMLGFLEKMTLRPSELAPADADAVRTAGVGEDALVDAIHVGALFNTIVRLADSFDFELLPPERERERAPGRLGRGYRLQPVPGPGPGTG